MSISLTPNQERFIQTKLQAGKYRSAEEVLEVALRLFDEYDRAETKWVEDVREKIDEAIVVSDHTPPIDGETFVNQIIERFQQVRQAQE
ncbi:MAG: type II toxin-antitoxin system ParD family antitoxin [Potamolinea sp.]